MGQRKHGYSRTPTYACYTAMKQRCSNVNTTEYPHYGGRGIKVCSRWMDSFTNFLEDMGAKPDGLTLDRIDNDDDYKPSNCRWATAKQQNTNRRSVVMVGETSLKDYCRLNGLSYETIVKRVRRGWDLDRALETPVYKHLYRGTTLRSYCLKNNICYVSVLDRIKAGYTTEKAVNMKPRKYTSSRNP